MVDVENIPVFNSVDEELFYWKKLANSFAETLHITKEEYEEFQLHSHELESELEVQLDQSEVRNKELRLKANRLKLENDELKEKLDRLYQSTNFEITELQNEISRITDIKDDLLKYVRELEQNNDDLERSKRATLASLQDFEQRLNQAIEKNAVLESELDEKEQLKIMVQRLKDESRDLRQELQIREKDVCKDNRTCGIPRYVANSPCVLSEPPLPRSKDIVSSPNHIYGTTRLSALNVVGDLLRKVGALESKLASCNTKQSLNPRGSLKSSDLSSRSCLPILAVKETYNTWPLYRQMLLLLLMFSLFCRFMQFANIVLDPTETH